MTSRERVRKALNHEEPDRVPIDLGSTVVTGISVFAYVNVLRELGLNLGLPRVIDLFQMLADVEEPVRRALGCDVIHLPTLRNSFGTTNRAWKKWEPGEGTTVLVPGNFNPKLAPEGDWMLFNEGGNPLARMPRNGFYFDHVGSFIPPAATPELVPIERRKSQLEQYTDEELDLIAAGVRQLHQSTDYALIASAKGAQLGVVNSFQEWFYLIAAEPAYLRDFYAAVAENALKNLRLLKQAVGDRLEAVIISMSDYGTQRAELLRPEAFRDIFAPHYKTINDWVHENTPWKTFYHCCGSIYNLLPTMVDMGVDVLNPVQCSAANMDAARLKGEFGDRLTFWGGGVDTQKTFPFGSEEEVRAEVAQRLRIFAPGGGFVFNAVHNIQANVPARNIIAAFQTVLEKGRYPVPVKTQA